MSDSGQYSATLCILSFIISLPPGLLRGGQLEPRSVQKETTKKKKPVHIVGIRQGVKRRRDRGCFDTFSVILITLFIVKSIYNIFTYDIKHISLVP
jgi:hypothetical protein